MEQVFCVLLPRLVFVACLVGLLLLYVVYYLLFNVVRPRVVCGDARKLRALRRHCPTLFERYWPTVWALNGNFQTAVRLLTQQAPSLESLNPRREKLDMSDGGYVCLDWFNEGGSTSDDDPIVLLLCGMTGSSDETYVRQWIDDCNQLGYRSVVFNYRGCGKTKISTPKLFTLGHVSDLTEVVEYIHSSHPSSTIVAVGVSMASLQLVRYVAECKQERRQCHISAILIFSVVWNLLRADESLHSNCYNRHVLSRFLTRRYTNIMKENRCVFEESQARGELKFDFETAIKATSLRELNESCVTHMFNFTHEDRMQHFHSPSQNASDVTVPVIAVTAVDDPCCPPDAAPVGIAGENPNLVLVTTRRGGHMGFLQGLLPFHKTYMNRVLSQFLTAVLEHDCFNPPASDDSGSIDEEEITRDTHTLL